MLLSGVWLALKAEKLNHIWCVRCVARQRVAFRMLRSVMFGFTGWAEWHMKTTKLQNPVPALAPITEETVEMKMNKGNNTQFSLTLIYPGSPFRLKSGFRGRPGRDGMPTIQNLVRILFKRTIVQLSKCSVSWSFSIWTSHWSNFQRKMYFVELSSFHNVTTPVTTHEGL